MICPPGRSLVDKSNKQLYTRQRVIKNQIATVIFPLQAYAQRSSRVYVSYCLKLKITYYNKTPPIRYVNNHIQY